MKRQDGLGGKRPWFEITWWVAKTPKERVKGLLTRNPAETTKQVKSKKKMGEAGRGSAGAPVARCPAEKAPQSPCETWAGVLKREGKYMRKR